MRIMETLLRLVCFYIVIIIGAFSEFLGYFVWMKKEHFHEIIVSIFPGLKKGSLGIPKLSKAY